MIYLDIFFKEISRYLDNFFYLIFSTWEKSLYFLPEIIFRGFLFYSNQRERGGGRKIFMGQNFSSVLRKIFIFLLLDLILCLWKSEIVIDTQGNFWIFIFKFKFYSWKHCFFNNFFLANAKYWYRLTISIIRYIGICSRTWMYAFVFLLFKKSEWQKTILSRIK